MAKKRASIKIARWIILIAPIVPIIAFVDTALPFLLRIIVIRIINRVEYMKGEVSSVHLSIFKRSLTIRDLVLNYDSTLQGKQNLSVLIEEVKLNFEWLSLWRGILKVDTVIISPQLVYTLISKNEDKVEVRSKPVENPQFVLLPVIIKRLQIEKGKVRYVDLVTLPKAELELQDIFLLIDNITQQSIQEATYNVSLRANVCAGELKTELTVRPNSSSYPDFDLNASLLGLNLVQLNSFFKAYAKLKVNRGNLDLFMEAKTGKGGFKGYVKPLIKDLEIETLVDKDKALLYNLWEAAVKTVIEIVENKKQDQVATEIPFEGTFKEVNIRVGRAVVLVFVNGFIRALSPSFDYKFDTDKSVDDFKN